MKRIDTWLDIQRYLSEAARMPLIPRETGEFVRVDLAEIQGMRGRVSEICVA
ncbi:MAG: hypothetical protein JWM46_314 [Candidatus Kaiserbacteria bacterium]|nr:hypothetical protein [Candidatus Kaiserbacteria bacterium]